MGHSNIWNSHPKNYGPGSRTCRVRKSSWVDFGSMGSCAAGSVSAATPRKLASSRFFFVVSVRFIINT
ncbi:UNVERIFIED_CONTAM: 40S ribosomal protein S29 [Sesamum angustifolium]|uniref:40S ribosomal protein S29 n=1 Tax=Sesamum angustifolium TaxID=2727405 RepID=A0AAW2MUG2_9LAMI